MFLITLALAVFCVAFFLTRDTQKQTFFILLQRFLERAVGIDITKKKKSMLPE